MLLLFTLIFNFTRFINHGTDLLPQNLWWLLRVLMDGSIGCWCCLRSVLLPICILNIQIKHVVIIWTFISFLAVADELFFPLSACLTIFSFPCRPAWWWRQKFYSMVFSGPPRRSDVGPLETTFEGQTDLHSDATWEKKNHLGVNCKPLFSSRKVFPKSATVLVTSNLAVRAWSIKCRRK